jgi:FtsH-binding integral membrane protein
MDNKLKKFSTLLRSKKELMGCIFLTLIFQLVVSVVTMKLDQNMNIVGNLFSEYPRGTMLGVFIIPILILISIMYSKSFATKQILFGLFSIILGLVMSLSIHIINDPKIVEAAAYSTLINFVLMFALGLIIVYFGYDLSWLGILLFISLLILITVQYIGYFTDKSNEYYKNISYISVAIFSLYILYDTNRILLKFQNKSKADCINGAMEYYLDIINLFISYLNIDSN